MVSCHVSVAFGTFGVTLAELLSALEEFVRANPPSSKRTRHYGVSFEEALASLRDAGSSLGSSELAEQLEALAEELARACPGAGRLVIESAIDALDGSVTPEQLSAPGSLFVGVQMPGIEWHGHYARYMQRIDAPVPPASYDALAAGLLALIPDAQLGDASLTFMGEIRE